VKPLCAPGYEPSNPTAGVPDITCQADGTWSTQTGCTKQSCGAPTAATGYVISSVPSTLFEASVTPTCASGFEETEAGIKAFTCVVNAAKTGVEWSAQNGCKRKDCKTPTAATGYTMPTGISNTLFEATVKPLCAPGYEPSNPTAGVPDITCQADGTWSTQTGCTKQSCGAPTAATGYVISSVPSTLFEASVTPTCASGFEETEAGIKAFTCVVNAAKTGVEWSAQNGCKRSDCGTPTAATGYAMPTSIASTVFEATVQPTCASGYEVDNTIASIKCQWNADASKVEWSAQSGCKRITCGEPPATTGYVNAVNAGKTRYQDTRVPTCATGFENLGTIATITCQADRSWSAMSGCTRVPCPAPTADDGYKIFAGDSVYESKRTVTCIAGFEGADSTITCQADKTWSAQAGCQRVSCGAPASVVGYVIPDGTSLFRDVRTLTCASGFEALTTIKHLKCQDDKSWSTPEGCTRVSCGSIAADTGYVLAEGTTKGTGTDYESTKLLSCAAGYEGSPAASITCNADRSWDVQTGCNKIKCPVPSAETGFVLAAGGLEFQDSRAVTCSAGYVKTPGTPTTIECQANKTWTKMSGCNLGDCGEPAATRGYVAEPETTTFGANSTFTCARGWYNKDNELEGEAGTITCQSDLTWTGFSGCTIVICEVPDLPLGYALDKEKLGEKLTYPEDYEFGKKHEFYCQDDFGFTYEGSNPLEGVDVGDGGEIQCLSNGNWTVASGCTLADASQAFNSPAATAQPVPMLVLFALAFLGIYLN